MPVEQNFTSIFMKFGRSNVALLSAYDAESLELPVVQFLCGKTVSKLWKLTFLLHQIFTDNRPLITGPRSLNKQAT